MASESEKEPIFKAPEQYAGESAPIYQERTKTKQMVRWKYVYIVCGSPSSFL